MDIKPLGEKALIVYFEELISEEVSEKVHSLQDVIRERGIPYLYDIVPGYRTLTLHYDPLGISYEELKKELKPIISSLPKKKRKGKLLRVPVVYGGRYGPDLEYVAKYSGISPEEVIKYHTSKEYLVYMLGFSPGFAYLGKLPDKIRTPRLREPRKHVEGGSVGIADAQTGVYAVPSPGGWRIIGRTYLRFFDPLRDPVTLVRAGDRVKFFPVSEKEFLSHMEEAEVSSSPNIKNPVFRVIHPGPLSIIVDKGRRGYRDIGLSECGPMDFTSYTLSHLLVENRCDLPAIEIFLSGFTIEILRDTMLSIVGGEFEVYINREKTYTNRKFFVRKGDVIKIGKRLSGMYLYLSIPGGITAPKVLGSASLDKKAGIGGIYGRPLKSGDLIPGNPSADYPIGLKLRNLPFQREDPIVLRFILGPDLDHFAKESISVLTDTTYEVTQDMDRMGYRLKGQKIPHSNRGPDIISEGVVSGTIQVPGDGMPIIMMKDAQSLGGYAKIGVVIAADMDKLSQASPGDRIKFVPITLCEAVKIYKEREKQIKEMIADCGRKFHVKMGKKIYKVEIEELSSS